MDELATDDVQAVGRKYRYAGPVEIDRLKEALRSDPRGRVRANAVTALVSGLVLSPRKDDLRPILLRALDDRDPDVETRAADGLANWFLSDPGVGPALTRHVDSLRAAVSAKDHIVQTHAIWALKGMGERPPTAALLGAISSADRRQGIEQAKEIKDTSAVPLLVQIAKSDPELVVRMEAVPVAAQLAPPETRDAFLAALIDGAQPGHVVEAAIRAAADTGAVAVVPRLRQILAEQKSGDTAAAAAAALQTLEAKH
jgi:HEAT repeat protein